MKYLKQFMIILAFSLAGELLHHVLPLPVPASIYGIILLFLALECKLLPVEKVEDAGKFLIEIMPVMFIPAAAGLIDSWDVLKSSWVSYLIAVIVSTVFVMIVAGRVTQFVMKKQNGRKGEAR